MNVEGLTLEDLSLQGEKTVADRWILSRLNETIEKVTEKYQDGLVTTIDGVSIEFADWRMNLRGSNTEPVIRLNIEAKTKELAETKLAELTEVIGGTKA